MKQVVFLAALMYSSAAVFGIPGEKRGLSDQSNDSSSKVRFVEVDVLKSQELSNKQLDRQTLEGMLGRASWDLHQAKKDVENYGWLYKDALQRIESADKRAKIFAQMFGENRSLKRGVFQDKRKAVKDSEAFLALYEDAEARKKSADGRVDMFTQLLTELEISKDSDQKSGEISVNNAPIEVISKSSGQKSEKSPVSKLYEYVRRTPGLNPSDLMFECEVSPEGKYNCIIHMNGEEYKLGDVEYSSSKEAKNAVAEHVYNILTDKKRSGEASSSGNSGSSEG